MPFNDSSSALVAVMITNPYADAGNVGPENLGRSGAPIRGVGFEIAVRFATAEPALPCKNRKNR